MKGEVDRLSDGCAFYKSFMVQFVEEVDGQEIDPSPLLSFVYLYPGGASAK